MVQNARLDDIGVAGKVRPSNGILGAAVGLCLARRAVVVDDPVLFRAADFGVALREATALNLVLCAGEGLNDRCAEGILYGLASDKAPAGAVVLGRAVHLSAGIVVSPSRLILFSKRCTSKAHELVVLEVALQGAAEAPIADPVDALKLGMAAGRAGVEKVRAWKTAPSVPVKGSDGHRALGAAIFRKPLKGLEIRILDQRSALLVHFLPERRRVYKLSTVPAVAGVRLRRNGLRHVVVTETVPIVRVDKAVDPVELGRRAGRQRRRRKLRDVLPETRSFLKVTVAIVVLGAVGESGAFAVDRAIFFAQASREGLTEAPSVAGLVGDPRTVCRALEAEELRPWRKLFGGRFKTSAVL